MIKVAIITGAIAVYAIYKLIKKRRRKMKKGWEEFVSEFRIDTSEWEGQI